MPLGKLILPAIAVGCFVLMSYQLAPPMRRAPSVAPWPSPPAHRTPT